MTNEPIDKLIKHGGKRKINHKATTTLITVFFVWAGQSGVEGDDEGADDNLMEEEVDKSLHLKVTAQCACVPFTVWLNQFGCCW